MKCCSVCHVELLPNGTQCHSCESPIGFPNVRKAISERDELFERYESIKTSNITRGISEVAERFEQLLKENSKLVLAKSVADVVQLTNPNKLITSYHNEIRMNVRLAQNNKYDQNRDGFESIVNPQYYDNIQYAVLSLTNTGSAYYGGVHLSLDLAKVQHRTTLFEENSYNFVKKQNLSAAEIAPKGYRSVWDDRAILATIKCSHMLDKDSVEDEFSSIILKDDPENPEFIEAHIYGNISGLAVESMTLISSSKDEKMILNAYRKSFSELGISMQIES
jgi:hypothetical protein